MLFSVIWSVIIVVCFVFLDMIVCTKQISMYYVLYVWTINSIQFNSIQFNLIQT